MEKNILALMTLCALSVATAQTVTLLDFTNNNTNGYVGNHNVQSVNPSKEGLVVVCHPDKEDPWIEGPALHNWPQGDFSQMYLDITFKGHGSSSVEIFYGRNFRAEDAVTVKSNNDDKWQTERAMIPKQPDGARLRIDPTNRGGGITIASIKLTPIPTLYDFKPQPAKSIDIAQDAPKITSGQLVVRHDPKTWDAFVIEFAGERLACGHSNPEIAILANNKGEAFSLKSSPATVTADAHELKVVSNVTDPLGAKWVIVRKFTPLPDNSIEIATSALVDRDTTVGHFPWLTLFPGLGSYGDQKIQATLPGVEYLQNEPSSNELDVRGDKANRLLVSHHKICFPMMAIVSPSKTWLSLSWNYYDYPAAIFDTPDRQFKSGASLFALWSPSVRDGRIENDLNVYQPLNWKADTIYAMKQVISAGKGESVIPAVKKYIEQNPLPPVPTYERGFQSAINLLAHGWLDSKCYVDKKWRHAVWGSSFGPQPATDALLCLNWIACASTDKDLVTRAKKRLSEVESFYKSGKHIHSGVSHGRQTLYAYLYFNRTKEWLDGYKKAAMGAIKTVRNDGSVHFTPYEPPKPNYGSTHWTDHANGFTAARLANAANTVLASANPELRSDFLNKVDKVLNLYKNDAPRGAQTWEVPLHTPDILGSAYMLDLATAAYAISGDDRYLEEADYWATTGLLFTYLVDPALDHGPVGRYATIAVFGATGWQAPYWIGQPVQWCGLVYRNSLLFYSNLLKDEKSRDFWRKLATGITITGLQESFQLDDKVRQGLLPDYYLLNAQQSDGPAINPGTVQNGLPEAYERGDIFGKFPVSTGTILHLLGSASHIIGDSTHFSAELKLWPQTETEVLVSGIATKPLQVTWNGKKIDFDWYPEHQALVMKLMGKGTLKVN
ncbi:MAG: hypothetical protein IKP58_02480 [Victivallales bacterium]|nr:hypothetical protein [Victivallales bacterium]